MIMPKQLIRQMNLILEMVDEKKQMQPCGVDLSVKEIHRFVSKGTIDFTNEKRQVSKTEKIEFEEKVHLEKGIYKIVFNEYVKIPKDYAAMCLTRSSLLRCGANMEFALWDPGYEGRSESLLIVSNPFGIDIYKNARVAQMIFVKLEEQTDSLYSGVYKGENKK